MRYIPAEGKLSYFESITVRVELNPAFKSTTQLAPRQSVPGDRDEIIRMVDNPRVAHWTTSTVVDSRRNE